jgi:hypothetical protein
MFKNSFLNLPTNSILVNKFPLERICIIQKVVVEIEEEKF